MNDNCRELIAKARALFAWRRPATTQVVASTPAASAPAASSPVVATPAAAPPAAATETEEAEAEGAYEPTDVHNVPEERRIAPLRSPSGSVASAGVSREALMEDAVSPHANGGDVDHGATGAADSFKRSSSGLSAGGSAGQAKRPKLQGATDSAAAPSQAKRPVQPNGTARPAAGDGAKPPPPLRAGSGIADTNHKPVSREMKCICGATEKVSNASKENFVVCRVCTGLLHPSCVEGALNRPPPDDFVCAPCRLEKVDEFHPSVGTGLLKHSYAACSSTFSLTFTSQAAQWKKQQWAVHLRSVDLGSSTDLSGPAWPHRVQGKLNGRQCVSIDPPKHLHVRREQCYNLTPLLRQGVNTLELRFHPKPDRNREEPDSNYCVGVVLTRPRSVASIIARIRTRSTETIKSGRARVERLIAEVTQKEAMQDECKVTGNFGRTLKPLCPVSFCPIELAAIGRGCNHVQVFDLQAYIAVNQRMRSLDKRWTCPVCSLPLRPDDCVLDPFSQGILDTLRGDEDSVEAIVFNEDVSWNVISAVKEDKERQAAEDGDEGPRDGAELIDLSDSE